jgi:hypothetical protein
MANDSRVEPNTGRWDRGWWEVEGFVELLAQCGITEQHPWFDNTMYVAGDFCGVTYGVDSVSEMVMKGLSAKFLKRLKEDWPSFPKNKCDKLREALAEVRKGLPPPTKAKRGRKSKFADDAVITWVTVENPHVYGSDRWCMWEVTYGSKNRGDFLARDGMRSPLHGHDTIRKPNSGYFNLLVSMGHIVIKE